MLRALLIGAVVLALPPAARARDLAEAVAAFDAGRFGEARAAFQEVLEAGWEGPDKLASLHLHLAIILALEGDADGAEAHLRVAFAVDPDLPLPDILNPTLRAQFEEVRAERGGAPLQIELVPSSPLESGRDVEIGVGVTDAPAGLVARTELRAGGESDAVSIALKGEGGGATVPGTAWRGATLDLKVRAQDKYGNVVAEVRRTLEGVSHEGETDPLATDASTGAPTDGGSSVAKSPWLWAAIGIALVGAATVTGVLLATRDTRYELGAPEGP